MAMQTPGRRPIGQILKDGGWLSQAQLEAALEEQKQSNEKLGEVLVRMGILEEGDLKAALSVQQHLGTLEQAVRLGAGVRQMLGALLLQSGRLSTGQLEQALAEQSAGGGRLGEICIRNGLLAQEELDALLAFQQHQDLEHPHPLRLGELLVNAGYLSRQHLDAALEKQRPGQKLGEVLVQQGFAQPAQVSHGLRLQQLLLNSALAALLSLATLSLGGCGGGGGEAATSLAPSAVSSPAVSAAPAPAPVAQQDFFTMSSDDYGLMRPNFYYSTNNAAFWSIQANLAKNVTDPDAVAVFRIDIPKNGAPLPALNRSFSIEDGTALEKFPGEFLVLNGAKSVHKKVERGIITFSPDSSAGGRVNGSFEVTLTDYDSNVFPAPQYHLKGSFNFVMGSYGAAPQGA
jgi:hypothetical protein